MGRSRVLFPFSDFFRLSALSRRMGGAATRLAGIVSVRPWAGEMRPAVRQPDVRQPTVRRLLLKGFRSIPAACIEFDNPTIFVGRNGSGKSSLVSAFSFLADAMRMPLQTAFDRIGGVAAVRNRSSGRGRPPNLAMRIELGGKPRASYTFEITARGAEGFSVVREQCTFSTGKERYWFDRSRDCFDSNVSGLNPPIDAASLALPLVGGAKAFNRLWRALSSGMRVYAVDSRRLRGMQEPDSGIVLMPDGANAASVLERIRNRAPQDFKQISEYLGAIVPHAKQVSVRRFDRNLALELTQAWGKDGSKRLGFRGSSISDGTLRTIGLLAAVYQRPAPLLIAVEEPEMSIHPGALGVVFDLLLEASERMQVIVTTHSPELLDEKEIRDRNLRMVEWSEGATRITSVSDANRRALEEGLMEAGGLLRTNALEAAQVSGEDVRHDLFDDLR